jgi:hypothetical protein
MEDRRSESAALLEPRSKGVAGNRLEEASQGYDPLRGRRLLRRANVALAAGVMACNPAPGLLLGFFGRLCWDEWMLENVGGAECFALCFIVAGVVSSLLGLWIGWSPYVRARQDLTRMGKGLMNRRGWEMTEEARVRARWAVWLAGVSGAIWAVWLFLGLFLFLAPSFGGEGDQGEGMRSPPIPARCANRPHP